MKLSRCNGEGGKSSLRVGVDLQSGMRGVSSVDSSSDEEDVGSSLFLVKEMTHSLFPIFGLSLVVLVLTPQGMDEGRTNARGLVVG